MKSSFLRNRNTSVQFQLCCNGNPKLMCIIFFLRRQGPELCHVVPLYCYNYVHTVSWQRKFQNWVMLHNLNYIHLSGLGNTQPVEISWKIGRCQWLQMNINLNQSISSSAHVAILLWTVGLFNLGCFREVLLFCYTVFHQINYWEGTSETAPCSSTRYLM